MADEPSNAELAWRMETLQRMVGELVGRPEYTARQESAEHRFADLAADVTRLDRRHDEDVGKLYAVIADHKKDHTASGMSWRTIGWTFAGGVAVALLGYVVQLLAGGH